MGKRRKAGCPCLLACLLSHEGWLTCMELVMGAVACWGSWGLHGHAGGRSFACILLAEGWRLGRDVRTGYSSNDRRVEGLLGEQVVTCRSYS